MDLGEVGGNGLSLIAQPEDVEGGVEEGKEPEYVEEDEVNVQRVSSSLIEASRFCSQIGSSSSDFPLTEEARELPVGLVHREPDLSLDLTGKGARVAGNFTGATPPVLLSVPASAAASGELLTMMNEGDDGVMGAGEAPAIASLVSSIPCPLPAVIDEVGQQPIDLVSPLIPTVGAVGGHGDGGVVSEEARAPPVARVALRTQPTDGLGHPPSSPVVPVSGVDGGGGKDGSHGCRSYANVVQVDRRADVELNYIPPANGGNTFIMEVYDGDRAQWGSCLVGQFLQGSLAFGFVRSSVTRQWTRSGLTEVKSLDEGFFVFRFVDSVSRDGVFEGGAMVCGGQASSAS
ncbi:hypothetical protein Dimus_003421 [Dionaea muscipula]